MSRNEPLFVRAQQAILDSFTLSSLRQLLFTRLSKDLEHITLGGDLDERVFDLLRRAGREGWAQALFDALAAALPGRPELAGRAQELRAGVLLTPPVSAQPRRSGPVPLQKPLRVQHFTGREGELARLLADLQPGAVLTLCGPGRMGKTALAAEAIWRLAPGDDPPDRFPDGILFHTFYRQPQAALALEAFARAYGVDPRQSPQDAARQALASRKARLILDGAEAADDLDAVLQVAGSCGVLITTRRHANAPAEPQDLEPLPQDESLVLLRAWAGKYADDDAAANDLVRLLGGLPLALFLVGRYLSQRKQAAGEYVPYLLEAGLEALHFGERPSKSVPLLLRRSLEQVSAGARSAFGVTGVLALAPFDVAPVAAALELSPAAAHHALGELVDYGLLLRPDKEYQVTHALAHTYAHTHAAPAAEVINRLALYYAALAEAEGKRGLPGYTVLDRQRAHLVAVQAGLNAARAGGSPYDEGAFLNKLGIAYAALGETCRAIEYFEKYLQIAREIGYRRGEGNALGNLGNAYYALGETYRAIELYEQWLVIAREIDDRSGEAVASWNLGLAHEQEGDLARAIANMEICVAYEQEVGHPDAAADAQRVAAMRARLNPAAPE